MRQSCTLQLKAGAFWQTKLGDIVAVAVCLFLGQFTNAVRGRCCGRCRSSLGQRRRAPRELGPFYQVGFRSVDAGGAAVCRQHSVQVAAPAPHLRKAREGGRTVRRLVARRVLSSRSFWTCADWRVCLNMSPPADDRRRSYLVTSIVRLRFWALVIGGCRWGLMLPCGEHICSSSSLGVGAPCRHSG